MILWFFMCLPFYDTYPHTIKFKWPSWKWLQTYHPALNETYKQNKYSWTWFVKLCSTKALAHTDPYAVKTSSSPSWENSAARNITLFPRLCQPKSCGICVHSIVLYKRVPWGGLCAFLYGVRRVHVACTVSGPCTCVCVPLVSPAKCSWECVCVLYVVWWLATWEVLFCSSFCVKKRLCDFTLCVALLSVVWSFWWGRRGVLNKRDATLSGHMPQKVPEDNQRWPPNTHTHTHTHTNSPFTSRFSCLYLSHYPSFLHFACGKTAVSIRPRGPWHRSHAKNPLRSWQWSSSSGCLCRDEMCWGSFITSLIQTVNHPIYPVI